MFIIPFCISYSQWSDFSSRPEATRVFKFINGEGKHILNRCFADSLLLWFFCRLESFFFGNKSKNRKEHLMMKIARECSTEDSHKATTKTALRCIRESQQEFLLGNECILMFFENLFSFHIGLFPFYFFLLASCFDCFDSKSKSSSYVADWI